MNLNYLEYKAIVEFSPNMIWRAGLDANCDYFNDTWLKFTGKKLEEEVGNGWLNGVHPDDMEACMNLYLESFQKRAAFEMEYRLVRHDGQMRWINDRGVPFYEEDGTFAGYIGSCVDVTEKIEGRNLTDMAHFDQLTGVYNRNYLEYLLDYEFHKARQKKTDVVYLMMDVDKFKFINDHYGHTTGDKVLKEVAQRVSESIREQDYVGRYGGDEFVVILSDASLAMAEKVAHRVIQLLKGIKIDHLAIPLSLSIGMVKQTDEKEILEIIEKADQAMYQAKQEGGGREKIFLGNNC